MNALEDDAQEVSLREVQPGDIRAFLVHQSDPVAARLAAIEPRDRDAHARHWESILADDSVIARTIVVGDEVVGNVVSWLDGDRRLVGYRLARSHWSRGIAAQALRRFIQDVRERPLSAYVATSNPGSIRVLEKAGFVQTAGAARVDEHGVQELLYELPA